MPVASQLLSFWCDFSFKITFLISSETKARQVCSELGEKEKSMTENVGTIKSTVAHLIYKLESPAQGVQGSLHPSPCSLIKDSRQLTRVLDMHKLPDLQANSHNRFPNKACSKAALIHLFLSQISSISHENRRGKGNPKCIYHISATGLNV